MSKWDKIKEHIRGNQGGFHADIRVDQPLTITHGEDQLLVYFNGHKGAKIGALTFKGSKNFKIDRGQK
jgi:hypothetical protein